MCHLCHYFLLFLTKSSHSFVFDGVYCCSLYKEFLTVLFLCVCFLFCSHCRQFMDSLGLEPESVDNLDMYSHIPPVLMEKCAALSVRPDTVKNLIQSMQGRRRSNYTLRRFSARVQDSCSHGLVDIESLFSVSVTISAEPYEATQT